MVPTVKPSLSAVQALITQELEALANTVRQQLQHPARSLTQITQHWLQHPGKQLRPQLVFLAAGMSGGITEKTRRGAALVTLLHSATLVHDDVVDEATQRRGLPAINAVWKNQAAVLFGDYLLAQGLLLAAQHQDYDCLEIIAATTRAMSVGELLQLEKARQLDLAEQDYFEIIHQKTAHLLGACLAIGALSAGALTTQVAQLQQLGEQVGMAFQIKDDLLDYGNGGQLGKEVGMDIKQGKITLPLLYTLQHTSQENRQKIEQALHQQEPHPVQEVIALVHASGGITYAQKVMRQYRDAALAHLQALEASGYQEALRSLIHALID